MCETNASFDFLSRECKTFAHFNCGEECSGFGIKVRCYCACHKRKQKGLGSDCDEITIPQNIATAIVPTNKIQKPF
jgi:hypothetical protein